MKILDHLPGTFALTAEFKGVCDPAGGYGAPFTDSV